MDLNTLIEALRGTMDANLREAAERQLNEGHSQVNFMSTLLQLTMTEQLDLPVRQAGVIYLKNMVTQFWTEGDNANTEAPTSTIPETDRQFIRDNIVEAIIQSPERIRVQLTTCIHHMIKHDYPGRWTAIVDKIGLYLQSDNSSYWLGILLCLYQLVKNYEYKKPEERQPLVAAMQIFMPMLKDRFIQLLPDTSADSVLVQKQILKILYALFQYNLPLDLPVRQAGVIYLKNMVTQFWTEGDNANTEAPTSTIPETDRQFIRDNIVEAIIQSPERIRVQLTTCIHHMIKHDYPGRWTAIVDKIGLYLQSDNSSYWLGILLCLYQLVKNYEYKKPEERQPLVAAMQIFMPKGLLKIIPLAVVSTFFFIKKKSK
nr:Ipo7 protein [Danio rerio]